MNPYKVAPAIYLSLKGLTVTQYAEKVRCIELYVSKPTFFSQITGLPLDTRLHVLIKCVVTLSNLDKNISVQIKDRLSNFFTV